MSRAKVAHQEVLVVLVNEAMELIRCCACTHILVWLAPSRDDLSKACCKGRHAHRMQLLLPCARRRSALRLQVHSSARLPRARRARLRPAHAALGRGEATRTSTGYSQNWHHTACALQAAVAYAEGARSSMKGKRWRHCGHTVACTRAEGIPSSTEPVAASTGESNDSDDSQTAEGAVGK